VTTTVLLRLLALLLALLPATAHSAVLELTDAPHVRGEALAAWCTADRGTPFEAIVAGDCVMQPPGTLRARAGFTELAYWLRLELRNTTPEVEERWIRVGHPRL
jgi:hypothetical protein